MDNRQIESNHDAWSPRSTGLRSLSIHGIFVVLIAFAMRFAAPVLKPIAVALLLSLVFAPVVCLMRKWRIPLNLAAALIVTGIMAVCALAVHGLAEPVSQWMEKTPSTLHRT